jgi:hypothetical protein
MSKITLKYIIDFFTDKSIIATHTKSNILELFQFSDEKCEKKFNDFIDLIMFIIDKDYDINTLSNKKNYLHTIVSDIINYIQDTQLLINKPKVISQIKNNELSQDIILIIAYIFDINIIIHENNILKVHYFSEKYNKYRNTILFKIEHDATDGTEYYKLLIDNDQFLFTYFSKNLQELLSKEYIIPIGFIPNKTYQYNDDPEKLINDRSILEIFVNKQVLEIKDSHNTSKQNLDSKQINSKNKESENKESENKEGESDNTPDDDHDNKLDEKLILDYANMQYNDDLESDSD